MGLHGGSSGRLGSRPAGGSAAATPGTHPLSDVGLPDALLHVPASAPVPAPLLVFFHGAGGHATSTLLMVRDVAEQHGVLLLLPTSAAATWDLLAGSLGRDLAALDTALDHVFGTCAVSRVAVGGFSDGASYALSIGLANGDLFEAVLAFSPGFMAPPALVGEPRVSVSHGTADAVLPVERCGRRVVAGLRRAGREVRYEEFDGPHVVPRDVQQAAVAWWLVGSPDDRTFT